MTFMELVKEALITEVIDFSSIGDYGFAALIVLTILLTTYVVISCIAGRNPFHHWNNRISVWLARRRVKKDRKRTMKRLRLEAP